MNIHSVLTWYFSKYLKKKKKNPYIKKGSVGKEYSSLSLQMLGNSNEESSIYVDQKRTGVWH